MPETAQEWFEEGNRHKESGEYREAVDCYFQAVQLDQNFEPAWLNQAEAQAGLGLNELALDSLAVVLALNPQNERAWLQKAMAFSRLAQGHRNEFDMDRPRTPQECRREEMACYDQALEINPASWPAWFYKGYTLARYLDRYREGLACLQQAQTLGELWDKDIIGICRRMLGVEETSPQDAGPEPAMTDQNDSGQWVRKGLHLGALGNHWEAIACFDRALRLDPSNYQAWLNKGQTLNDLAWPEKAIDCLDSAINAKPRLAPLWSAKGEVLWALERQDEAIGCFEAALDMDPKCGTALVNMGQALKARQRYEEVIPYFDRALDLNSRDAQTWNGKGMVLRQLERNDEAVTCYDRALEIRPRYALAWFNKGAALGNSRRFREALACFQEAERLGSWHASESVLKCRQYLGQA